MHVQSFFPAFSHLSRFVFILLFMDFGCIYFITEPGDAGASVGRVLPLLSIDSLKGVMYLSFWEVCTQSNYSPAQTRSLNYPFITPVVYYLSFLLFCLFVYSRHFPRPRNTDWMISSIFAINNHLITNPNRAFSCRHTPALVTFLWGGWGIFFSPSLALEFHSAFSRLSLTPQCFLLARIHVWRLRCLAWGAWRSHGQRCPGWGTHCCVSFSHSRGVWSFFLPLFYFNVHSLIYGPQVHRTGLIATCGSRSLLGPSPLGSLLLVNSLYCWFALGFNYLESPALNKSSFLAGRPHFSS